MNAGNATKMIRGVLFDFDGTLTEPGSLDFRVIKDALGCPPGLPVLEFILNLESEKERTRAFGMLDRFEAEAARRSRPNEGAEEMLAFLRQRNLKIGIISRNSLESIQTSLRNFQHIKPADFAVILSRDDPYKPKPDSEGILAAARKMELPVSQILVVGDFVFDIEAGHEAGALTAFLTNRGKHSCAHPSDFTLERLGDLREIIRYHAPLPQGKLPNDLPQNFPAEGNSRHSKAEGS
jgi:hydrogenase expression/formation protein HypE